MIGAIDRYILHRVMAALTAPLQKKGEEALISTGARGITTGLGTTIEVHHQTAIRTDAGLLVGAMITDTAHAATVAECLREVDPGGQMIASPLADVVVAADMVRVAAIDMMTKATEGGNWLCA